MHLGSWGRGWGRGCARGLRLWIPLRQRPRGSANSPQLPLCSNPTVSRDWLCPHTPRSRQGWLLRGCFAGPAQPPASPPCSPGLGLTQARSTRSGPWAPSCNHFTGFLCSKTSKVKPNWNPGPEQSQHQRATFCFVADETPRALTTIGHWEINVLVLLPDRSFSISALALPWHLSSRGSLLPGHSVRLSWHYLWIMRPTWNEAPTQRYGDKQTLFCSSKTMADTSAWTDRKRIKGSLLWRKTVWCPLLSLWKIYAQTEPNFIFHINAEAWYKDISSFAVKRWGDKDALV